MQHSRSPFVLLKRGERERRTNTAKVVTRIQTFVVLVFGEESAYDIANATGNVDKGTFLA
jgi:hypothetical protein